MNKLSRREVNGLPDANENKVCNPIMSAHGGNNTRRRISGRQKNHGDFYLPAIISHLEEPSFYIAVAWWGLLLGRSFTREDVAQAFRVTARRAADVMTYLVSGVSRSVVGLEKKVVRVESGRSVLLMTILSVNEQGETGGGSSHGSPTLGLIPRKKSARPRDGKAGGSGDELRAARDLFLRGRRTAPSSGA